MRTLARAVGPCLVLSLAACGGIVRPSSDGGATDARSDAQLATDARTDARTDASVPRPDVIAPPDVVVPPQCPPGESAAGRCDGTVVLRCVDGSLVSELCSSEQRCVGAASGVPARCVAIAMGDVSVAGRVTYARRPLTARGLGPAAPEGLVGVSVQLVNSANTVRAEGLTDAMGNYALAGRAPADEMLSVRVRAVRGDATYQFSVENFGGAVYAVTSGPFAAAPGVRRDVDIPEAMNGGAFAIFSTIRDGLDFVRRVLPRAAPLLRVRWERGRTPPGGTSYFVRGQNAIYLLGGPTDTDEFDLPVIFHEFGHFVEQNYSRTSSPGGSHDGSPTDPRLAWGEGWGTWFGCVANNSSQYIDSDLSSGIRVSRDLAMLPLQRQNMGDPTMPINQRVGEYLVAGSLWALSSAGMDPARQLDRSLAVSLRYFTRVPPPDRGVTGVDFVDFLDGYMCLHAEADRAVVQQYVVMQRQFPYDFAFAGVCR